MKPLVNPTHHPEVQQPDHVAWHQHDIARMRIGMIETVPEDHLQVQVGPTAGDFRQVQPGQPLLLGQLDSLDQFHRQHPGGR